MPTDPPNSPERPAREQPPRENARIVKRSLRIAGHATSISLEEPFWRLLHHVAAREGLGIAALVEKIDRERRGANLSSSVRVHLLEWMLQAGDIVLPEDAAIPEKLADNNEADLNEA